MLLAAALLLVAAVAIVVRRRALARDGGTFELSVRVRQGRPGRGWVLGIGRYRDDRLQCFRIFSLSPRPRRTWKRHALQIDGRREPVGAEAYTLFAGHVVVQCSAMRHGHEVQQELAMSPASLLGLQSWLESSPPASPPREG